jgi:DNA primase
MNTEVSVVKSRVNIVDFIGQFVQLTRSGKGYLGLCPFHGEKTPSFNVNEEKQFYHCFGCGKSGDVFQFVQDYKHVEFPEALQEVASYAGVTLERSNQPTKVDQNQIYYDINAAALDLFKFVLNTTVEGQQAREYLHARGITDELIETFEIGLTLDQNDFLYQQFKGKYPDDALSKIELFNYGQRSVYDAFRNRIMFPIKDIRGRVIGFSGRIWQETQDKAREGKYKNTATSPVFHKSRELYNLNRAVPKIKKTGDVYLMEGFMDVMAAHTVGLDNAVATMGTALTSEHLQVLHRYAKKLILVFDGDAAGQSAIDKALAITGTQHSEIVRVPGGMDPDEYNRTYPGKLNILLENNRISATEYYIQRLKPEHFANIEQQLTYIRQVAPYIVANADLAIQDAYIRKLSTSVPDFDYAQVEPIVNEFREGARTSLQQPSDQQLPPDYDHAQIPDYVDYLPPEPGFDDYPQVDSVETSPSQVTHQPIVLDGLAMAERHLLCRVIAFPDVLKRLMNQEGFVFRTVVYQQLFEKLIVNNLANGSFEETSFVHSLAQDEREAYYDVMMVNLPDQLENGEINQVLGQIERQATKRELSDIQQRMQVAAQLGNHGEEFELLQKYMALKQEMMKNK